VFSFHWNNKVQVNYIYEVFSLSQDEEYESRNHLIQWWDQAVTEELEKVNHKLDSALRHGQLACNHALESIRETIQLMQGEIETLKERLLAKEVEIDRLRALLSTW